MTASRTVMQARYEVDQAFRVSGKVVTRKVDVGQKVRQGDVLATVDATDYKLTVEGELNKLASNISIGQNAAGVHWRSDATQGMELGEAIAARLLLDQAYTFHEPFSLSFRRRSRFANKQRRKSRLTFSP